MIGRIAPNPRLEDEEAPDVESRQQAYGLGRVLAISDGVFAFALTLLVVQLTVPEIPLGRQPEQLPSALMSQMPIYFSYILSFAAIAMTWYGHHQSFGYIQRFDARLIGLNFGQLLIVAVMPFPTAILGRYGDQPLAAALYAAVIAIAGLLAAAIWWYATHQRRLVSQSLDSLVVRRQMLAKLGGPAIFLLTIPLALWRPFLAEVIWGLAWIGIVWLGLWRSKPASTQRTHSAGGGG